MKRALFTTLLLLTISPPLFAQFNLGLGLGSGGPRSYFLEVEPNIELSERVKLGLSIIRGRISNRGSVEDNRVMSIIHIDSNYKITSSGLFLGLGVGLTKQKGEITSSSGVFEFQNTQFSFMPKIGFQRKLEVSISGLHTYYKKNESISAYYMLNILYILKFK